MSKNAQIYQNAYVQICLRIGLEETLAYLSGAQTSFFSTVLTSFLVFSPRNFKISEDTITVSLELPIGVIVRF